MAKTEYVIVADERDQVEYQIIDIPDPLGMTRKLHETSGSEVGLQSGSHARTAGT